jgi:hypothetical protein
MRTPGKDNARKQVEKAERKRRALLFLCSIGMEGLTLNELAYLLNQDGQRTSSNNLYEVSNVKHLLDTYSGKIKAKEIRAKPIPIHHEVHE